MDDNNTRNRRSQNPSNRSKKRRKHKKKKNKGLKIALLSILFILLFSIGFGAFYITNLMSNVNRDEISDNKADLGIEDEYTEQGHITNILLLGIDKRETNEKGRSDAMMILTVDTKHDKIKLTSLMRDSYVAIDKHGNDKLNHAYAFGGAQLAIKTVNQNYGLNISDYVLVDYDGLEAIIDALGGVEIDIKEKEFDLVNDYIHDLAVLKKVDPPYLKKSGTQTLTGIQAVAYSRIRYVGDGDFERTERQRRVLSGIFEEIKTSGITKYPSIVNKLLPYVTTSLSNMEMINTGTNVLKSGLSTIEQMRFPIDGYYQSQKIYSKTEKMDLWYLVFNKDMTKKQMYDYIFEDIAPTPGNVNKPDLGTSKVNKK